MEKVIYINDKPTDYSVDLIGNVYSSKHGRKIKLKTNVLKSSGYHIVRLYINGEKHDKLVARIVAETFVLNPDNKPQVNHLDGDKNNNAAGNLQWVTQSENIKHAYDTKLMIKTHKDCYNALLDENKVKQIRILLKKKSKQRLIAKDFNVSEQVISSIKHGRSYKGVGLIE